MTITLPAAILRKALIASAACIGLVAVATAAFAQADAAQTQAAQSEDQRLAAFFEEIFQRNLARSPLFQSQIGMKTADYGKWDDFSDEEAARQNELVDRKSVV